MKLLKRLSSFVLNKVDRIIILLFVVFIVVSFIIWVFDHVIYSLLQVSSFVIANWLISVILIAAVIFIILMLKIDEKSRKEGFKGEGNILTKFVLHIAGLVARAYYRLKSFLLSLTDSLSAIIVWGIFLGIIIYIIYVIYNHIIKPIVSIF